MNNNEITGDFVVEWNNHLTSNNQNYFIFAGTSDTVMRMDTYGLTGECHIKLEVKDMVITQYIDGNKVGTINLSNRSVTDGLTVRFQLNNGANPVGYSSFMIYPI